MFRQTIVPAPPTPDPPTTDPPTAGPPTASPASGRPGRHFFPRLPRWAKYGALVVVLLVFRRIVAWAVLAALSAGLQAVGADVHLPHVSFGWPWSAVTSGTTTTTVVGPIVLQKIEGIDSPALGTDNFSFVFTHTESKSLGIWPCWYSATFDASGRASATVDLNPGPAWWKSSTGHYTLRVLRKPTSGTPGEVAITMALPLPELPQSVHDVSVDNTLSKPISTDHSWTYPGFGCGVLINPDFPESVLYAQAQQEAFYQSTHTESVTKPLIATAEQQATTIIRDNFIVPTLNALGYTVSSFSIRWVLVLAH